MLLLFYLLVLFMDSFGAVKCIKAATAAGIFSYSQRMMCTIRKFCCVHMASYAILNFSGIICPELGNCILSRKKLLLNKQHECHTRISN